MDTSSASSECNHGASSSPAALQTRVGPEADSADSTVRVALRARPLVARERLDGARVSFSRIIH